MIKKRKAFTLTELLVVIGILGIISSIAIFSMNGAKKISRDDKRKVDIQSIASGMEMYWAENKTYPKSCQGISCEATVANYLASSFPKDPKISGEFGYKIYSDENGSDYAVIAKSEAQEGICFKVGTYIVNLDGCSSYQQLN